MIVLKTMMRQRLRRSAKKICATFCRTLHDDTGRDAAHSCAAVDRLYCSHRRTNLLWQSKSPGNQNFLPGLLQHHRLYSTNSAEEYPRLTELPKTVKPRLFSGFKFMLMDLFTIRPQLDPDFSLRVFLPTTRKVVQVVSNRLATCDYDTLQEMVTPHVFDQLKKNLPYFSEKQRDNLIVDIEDIVITYVDNIRIDDLGGRGAERNLQITTVHHVMKNAAEVMKMFNDLSPFESTEELKRKKESLQEFVANFSFSRTYNVETQTAGDWIINGLNFYAKRIEF